MPGAAQRSEHTPSSDPVTLDDVLATGELGHRPVRRADFPAEIAALHALAQRLADQPDTMLDRLLQMALQLCHAGTAGLSLLETGPAGESVFRWAAMAGALASHVGGSTPRDFSPCGVCADRGRSQLFAYPERYFTYFQAARPAIVEGLVIPIAWHGEILGTIWIASHDGERRFDAEDARVMESLASFTAAALCMRRLATAAESAAREDERSAWLRALINAQEDERRRVARELHDEMSQHLTGLTLGIQALGEAPAARREAMCARLQDTVARIDHGVHRLARALRPAELDDLGLISAIGAFVDEWARQTGTVCDLSVRGCDERFSAPLETTVYRIAQEALTNVARHAQASHASVVIERRDGHAVLIVDDDGCGFDAAAAPGTPPRFGLIGIRERAALLGGTVSIESSISGTTVFVTLPLVGAARRG